MPLIQPIIRAAYLSLAALLLVLTSPIGALADDACVPPPSTQPGVHWPVGADSVTFVYQCQGPYTGKWTNDYYVYDPATTLRTPLYNLNYQYDCTANQWSKAQWDYSPADSQYHLSRVTATDPGLPTGCPVVSPVQTEGGDAKSASIIGTGPGSNSTINNDGTVNTTLNNGTTITVDNTISGIALSGDSTVLGNTQAGGATSGNAQDMATILNMLQSSSNALGGDNVVTFVANIDGDVEGDLLLDPAALGSIQNAGPDSANTLNNNLNTSLTVNNSVDASINNDVDLTAQSGDATVANNTKGGDATSGSAKVIANVVNMINSSLVAGKSFIGVININGNLNGDILLPPDFIDQLIAANVPTVTITGPGSTNTSNNTTNNNTTVTNTNNLGITNNVNANAGSGQAAVTNNTDAGSANSGNASTHITAFNLTGSSVIGKNAILVFVNVAGGKWVGLIVNAPAGSTAATLGGSIVSSGPNSTNTANNTVNNDTTVNNTANLSINNNIRTDAQSGDANVNGNTNGGSARSGDADSAVNLANVENSNLVLSNWFGILFINVFGTWNGSFGVNTSAGDPIATGLGGPGGMGGGQLFGFVPHTESAGNTQKAVPTGANFAASGFGGNADPTAFFSAPDANSGALAAKPDSNKGNGASPTLAAAAHHANWILIIGSTLAFGTYLLGERFYTGRQALRSPTTVQKV